MKSAGRTAQPQPRTTKGTTNFRRSLPKTSPFGRENAAVRMQSRVRTWPGPLPRFQKQRVGRGRLQAIKDYGVERERRGRSPRHSHGRPLVLGMACYRDWSSCRGLIVAMITPLVSKRVRSPELAADSMRSAEVSLCPLTVLANGIGTGPPIEVIVATQAPLAMPRALHRTK